MRKFLLVLLIPLFLIACGSDSGFPQEINHQQLADLKGRSSIPEFSELDVTNGDSVYLNYLIRGKAARESTISGPFNLIFIPNSSGYIYLELSPLTSTCEYLIGIDSEDDVSFHRDAYVESPSVFYVDAARVYRLTIHTCSLSEELALNDLESPELIDFEFKLLEANRESLELTENEFLVDVNYNGEWYGVGRSGSYGIGEIEAEYNAQEIVQKNLEDYNLLYVVNFVEGYKKSFGELFYAEISGSQLMFNWDRDLEYSHEILRVNSYTGEVIGSYEKKHCISLSFICSEGSSFLYSEGVIRGKVVL